MGERRAIDLSVQEVNMDSSSLVYSLGCGPVSGSPAAPSGTSSPVLHVSDADALILPGGSKRKIYEAVCWESAWYSP